MTRLDADWLRDSATQQALGLLTGAGHRALVVGGCVRNALLGVPVNDVDIATSAAPEDVIALAERAGLRTVPTGVDHGTVTLLVEGDSFEITTFRRDVETDGRHAVVSFAATLEDDAERRDFTMNALYADAGGDVLDPMGGLEDLRARRVRFVGDAGERIREDYLRSLRFFRFHAQYGDPDAGLDPDALAAIADNLAGLDRLAAERVWSEMRKLLSADDPAPAVATMEAAGVLAHVLPGASARALGPLVHLEGQAGVAPDPIRRLAALGGDATEDRLRLSRKEARHLELLRQAVERGTPLAELAWREGAALAWDVALLLGALTETPLSEDTGRVIDAGATAVFPLSAADLMPDLSGATLGRALKTAERAWIDSGFSLDRQSLVDIALKAG